MTSPLQFSWPSQESGKEKASHIADMLPPTSDNCVLEKDHNGSVKSTNCESYLSNIEVLENEIKYLKKENSRLQLTSQPTAIFDLANFAHNDKKILYYTGFQTYQILLTAFKCILPSGQASDISVSPEKGPVNKLTAENQFFLSLIRLRRGMCVETLADMFSISETCAENIFLSWVNLMCLRLGCLDIWPNRDELLNRATDTMKEKYPGVIGSIGCTEFFIQCLSSLVKQSQSYSNFKQSTTTTLKSLIMIDLGGAILYASPLFTGSISDMAILEASGFIKILKEKVNKGQVFLRDIILADKGFNVSDLLQTINFDINIPVFRVSGHQFTADEIAATPKVAHERIHVEHAIGRLKTYRILSVTQLPNSCLGNMEQIYTVCVLLCNFRYALIK